MEEGMPKLTEMWFPILGLLRLSNKNDNFKAQLFCIRYQGKGVGLPSRAMTQDMLQSFQKQVITENLLNRLTPPPKVDESYVFTPVCICLWCSCRERLVGVLTQWGQWFNKCFIQWFLKRIWSRKLLLACKNTLFVFVDTIVCLIYESKIKLTQDISPNLI